MTSPSIEINTPDLAPYRDSGSGLPYVVAFDSGRDGPHVVITAH